MLIAVDVALAAMIDRPRLGGEVGGGRGARRALKRTFTACGDDAESVTANRRARAPESPSTSDGVADRDAHRGVRRTVVADDRPGTGARPSDAPVGADSSTVNASFGST